MTRERTAVGRPSAVRLLGRHSRVRSHRAPRMFAGGLDRSLMAAHAPCRLVSAELHPASSTSQLKPSNACRLRWPACAPGSVWQGIQVSSTSACCGGHSGRRGFPAHPLGLTGRLGHLPLRRTRLRRIAAGSAEAYCHAGTGSCRKSLASWGSASADFWRQWLRLGGDPPLPVLTRLSMGRS